MMKLLKQLGNGFIALKARDRIMVIAVVSIGMMVGGYLAVLKKQTMEIQRIQLAEIAHMKELSGLKAALDQIESEASQKIDPLASQRATLAEMRLRIKETETFLGGTDSTASQVGNLIRNLIRSNPDLSLVSLKTRPSSVFFTPPPPPKAQQETTGEVAKVLEQITKKEQAKPLPVALLVNKTIYKHGVEIVLKGSYAALLSYMEDMQKFPKRIFWSDTKLDARNHRQVTLSMLVYVLSSQPSPPLN